MKRSIALLLCLCLLCSLALSACPAPSPFDPNTVGEPSVPVDLSFGKTDAEMFTDRDKGADYDASQATRINLSGKTIECDATDVKVEGSKATITGGGTYLLSGTLEGNIVVNAGHTEKPHIILDGVDITASGACILVLGADKVTITLATGSRNILVNDGSFAPMGGVNVDGTIFSRADLSLNGDGALDIYSVGGHGIVSNDDLVITGGTYKIEAVGHALKGNDSIRVSGDTSLSLDAKKDGLHAENKDDPTRGFVYITDGSFVADVEGDAISASAHMQIKGGNFSLKTKGAAGASAIALGGMPIPRELTDTPSQKGLKAGTGMLIEGGTFAIDTLDDALHAGTVLAIKGGTFSLRTGDDAIHSDVTLAIFGGSVSVLSSYEGLEAIHVEMLGGNVSILSENDGINASRENVDAGGTANIAGGVLYIDAAGDGIDTSGSFTMSGGQVTVACQATGAIVLDYNIDAIITGGFFIGTGPQMMAGSFSSASTQGVISLSVGAQPAGTEITLSGGNASLSYASTLPFTIAILSTPDMVKGEEYTVKVGELSSKFQAY